MADSCWMRGLLVFALLMLITGELCLILWGGDGTFSQAQRVGFVLLGLLGIVLVMAWRSDD